MNTAEDILDSCEVKVGVATDDLHYKTVRGFRVKKKKSELEKRLSEDEEKVLLESFTHENHKSFAKRNKAICLFLLNTGLRIGEFVALQVSDVLGINGSAKNILDVRPETAKRKKARQVPLNMLAKQAIKDLLEGRSNVTFTDKLVTNLTGKPLSKRAVQEIVKVSCLKAGINRLIGPHLLRHTALSKLYSATGNIKIVQTIAGHSNASLTINLYTHTTIESLAASMEKIAEQAVDAGTAKG